MSRTHKFLFLIKGWEAKVLKLLIAYFGFAVIEVTGLALFWAVAEYFFSGTGASLSVFEGVVVSLDHISAFLIPVTVSYFAVRILLSIALQAYLLTFYLDFESRMRFRIAEDFLRYASSQDMTHTQELATKAMQSVGLFSTAILQTSIKMAGDLMLLFSFFFLSAKVLEFNSSDALLLVPLVVIIPAIFPLYRLLKNAGTQYMRAYGHCNRILNTFAISVEELKFGAGKYLLTELNHWLSFVRNSMFIRQIILSSPRHVVEGIVLIALVLFMGAFPDNLSSFAVIAAISFRAMTVGLGFFNSFLACVGSIHAIDDVYQLFKLDKSRPSSEASQLYAGENDLCAKKINAIELRNLSVKQGQNYIFEGLTASFGLGLNVVVGSSGSGKTTLIRTILGYHPASDGDIFVNGNAESSSLIACPQRVSYVPQNPVLFAASVLENVIVPEEKMLEGDIMRANKILKELDLDEIVADVVQVSDLGLSLSGGQRYRICIARAAFADRDVLVLDEPTASLDLDTSKVVIDFLKNIARTKVIIVVSHDVRLIKSADVVIDLGNL